MTMTRKERGKLYVWTYPETSKSYAGWHFTAAGIECARLSEAIERLAAGSLIEPQVFASSPVHPGVLAVPNNRRAKARFPKELRVAVAPDPRHFSLEERDDVLTISVGSGRLEELRKNIIGITQNQGDFAMGAWDGKR